MSIERSESGLINILPINLFSILQDKRIFLVVFFKIYLITDKIVEF